MRLTCYGGVGQIGGNKILLEDGQARLFFDFGIPFGDRGRFFEEFLNPRATAGLLDVIEMGLLPPLQGLYRPDFIPTGRFWERIQRSPHLKAPLRELEQVDGVLISHAHVDHNGYLSFLRSDIPIYSSAMTGYVAKAMQDSGRTDFEHESVYAVPREERGGVIQTMRSTKAEPAPALQRPYRFYDLARLSPEARDFWAGTPGARELAHVPPGAADSIGGLALRCYPVDHSIFGSTAFAVETSAGWVAYTGDLRLQGASADATQRFVQEMARLRPRVLICEGTRLTPEASAEPAVTEEQVRANALQAIRDASGLVVADFSPRNIERLRAFLDIAQETGRHLVVLDKDAYLLNAMHLVDPRVPSVEEAPNLLIYQDLRASLDLWQRDLRERLAHRFVGPGQVQAHLGEFILCFSFWDVKNLIDIEPPNGLYLYSSSEVYDEEGEMDIKRLHNWLKHFNMAPLGAPVETVDEMGKAVYKIPKEQQGYHASGHATGEDILTMVRSISPQTVVPVHTEHPELFVERLRGSGIEVRAPEYGVAMEYT
ncbi:MAG TPA: MBL fold metallo-hydrolase RNA specificity domain-containing protein [Dehalococcoidia bacterium]|nr:MBL fold metallo-hydrolase RNA specificity domain-containing protein [Dehalococcoidia bacterium]